MAIKIDYDKCINCGLCIPACPFGCMTIKDDKLIVGEGCNLCGACQNECPSDAISLEEPQKAQAARGSHQGVWVFAEQRDGKIKMVSFELIPLIFILIMIYITYYSFKRKQIKKYGLVFWMCVWIAGILLVIFHSYLNTILEPLNVTRVFDLYTIMGFIGLLFISFYLFRALQRVEDKIENLAREVALKPVTKAKKSESEGK